MNKTAIKNFAVWARQKLISESIYKAGLVGITEKEILSPLPQSGSDIQFFDIGTGTPIEVKGSDISKRNALVTKITEKANETDYKTAFEFVIEEVAYTWFNRLIAIRFMEVNEYLPSGIRVLSSETAGKNEPDIVANPFDTDIDFSDKEKDLIWQYKDENKLDELFRFLFIKQCNKLNEVLPNLFEKTNNYTELLLSISFTDTDGVLRHLVNDISEEDFGEAVEIIGWLYQYYNTEPKDKVFANLKKNIKISKENIPAATQLFTPDWIVRYMVENSLGRIAVEKLALDPKAMGWKYYLEEAEQTEEVKNQLAIINGDKKDFKLEELKVIDPCMGSGHILVYAFDVLMQIYESQGYTSRDAVASIMENNLFGLDIDERAYQLSYFALMMKARASDRRFLTREIAPQVYCPKGYADGEEYGSLLNVDELEEMPQMPEIITFDNMNYEQDLNTWNFRRLLNQKYDVVVTNPPYMGRRKSMSEKLSAFIDKNYDQGKMDMFSAFIIQNIRLCKPNGYCGFMTPFVWLYLNSYLNLREYILQVSYISTLTQLQESSFSDAAVSICTFILSKSNINYTGTYLNLKDFIGEEIQPIKVLEGAEQFNDKFMYNKSMSKFYDIPDKRFVFWISDTTISAFDNKELHNVIDIKQGITTSDNERFLRKWYETNNIHIGFSCSQEEAKHSEFKWFPYSKGGENRKWYGNNEFVINYQYDGKEIKEFHDILNKTNPGGRLKNKEFYFRKSVTWSDICGSSFAVRSNEKGFLFDVKGSSAFTSDKLYEYILGLMNSKIVLLFCNMLNPSVTTQVGDIKQIPLIYSENHFSTIKNYTLQNISLSKTDWDSFETSWDFARHPLRNYGVSLSSGLADDYSHSIDFKVENDDSSFFVVEKDKPKNISIQSAFELWETFCEKRFNQLKANEEELNRIFIDIYGLQDELTPEVEDKDVTVRLADKTRDIKSFISYAVGCMFGRYSLDVDGLAYAGGEFDNSKYASFIPDADNVIPITDEEYFGDDIIGRFAEFVKTVYGADTLEENLDFIASALTNKGNTSREVIRNYFLKDFYKDHVKTYQKRPIYWLYDSGKQDGFKALVYMHRYNADTTGLLRVDYLHKIQRTYENEIEHMKDNIDNNHDVAKSTKRMEKLIKQLQETKEYDEKIAYLALSRIEIDLDDGVKVNYEKVQTGQDGKKLEVLGKV